VLEEFAFEGTVKVIGNTLRVPPLWFTVTVWFATPPVPEIVTIAERTDP